MAGAGALNGGATIESDADESAKEGWKKIRQCQEGRVVIARWEDFPVIIPQDNGRRKPIG